MRSDQRSHRRPRICDRYHGYGKFGMSAAMLAPGPSPEPAAGEGAGAASAAGAAADGASLRMLGLGSEERLLPLRSKASGSLSISGLAAPRSVRGLGSGAR